MNATYVFACPPTSNAYDSDVAGVGFVISFYATALVGQIAVFVAYLMGSLPIGDYTEVDILLVGFIRYRSVGLCDSVATRKALQQGQRFQSCFEKLLDNLADQQLVFSLAVLVAVLLKWRQISLYELEMAWTLATISLVTHMTAIRYSPKYIRGRHLLGVARAGGIFIVLIGFVSINILLEYAQFQASRLAIDENGLLIASVAWRMQLACLFSQPMQAPPGLMIDVFWSTAALIYYVNILVKLKTPNKEIYAFSFIYRGILYLLGGKFAKWSEFLGDYRSIYTSRFIWIKTSKIPAVTQFCLYLAEMEAAYLAIKTSLSADIPWLIFVLIYCLAQLKSVWLDSAAPFWDSASQALSLGVGQIIALVSFTGVLFNAADAFFGAKSILTLPIIVEMRSNDTEAAHTESVLDEILSNTPFRYFLFMFAAWNMTVLIYAGVISGGPWTDDGLNISVVCLIASLFTWEVVLELYNLTKVIRFKF